MMSLSRIQKQIIVLINDIVISIFSTWLALFLRLNKIYLPDSFYWHENIIFAFLIPIICFIPIFITVGIYKVLFRFSGLKTLRNIFLSSFLYGLIFASIIFSLKISGIPRSIGIVQPIIFTLLVVISRITAVQFIEFYNQSKNLKKAIIYGTGKSGIESYNAISKNENYQIVAFIDNDSNKIGNKIDNVPIKSSKKLTEIIETKDITNIFVAIPSMKSPLRKKLISDLENYNLNIKFLPSFDSLFKGKLSVRDFEHVNLDDILERNIELDLREIKKDIENKVILITGGGGSIGSELSKQILFNSPKKLLILDHSEFNLYSIMETLNKISAENKLRTPIIPILLSIQEKSKLENVFKENDIDNVYHAAAYKHVPLLETNIIEGVKNNIFGTNTIVNLSSKYNCSKFILVSTDKAVRPTNIMGASKRFSEMIVQAYAAERNENSKTLYGIVRFGNVVNSSGSVIPLFSKQINFGGPLTVTHPDITRFFMTIPEATSLILQSSLLAKSGEVFVLNMGKPIKILDLAKKMIRLSGLEEKKGELDGDIEIVFTGLRPGEKLYEELFIDKDSLETINKDIFIAKEKFINLNEINFLIKSLNDSIEKNESNEVKNILFKTKLINFNTKVQS